MSPCVNRLILTLPVQFAPVNVNVYIVTAQQHQYVGMI